MPENIMLLQRFSGIFIFILTTILEVWILKNRIKIKAPTWIVVLTVIALVYDALYFLELLLV